MSALNHKPDVADLDALRDAFEQPLSAQLEALLEQARAHEKWPTAQLISLFERSHRDSLIVRHQIGTYLHAHADTFNKQALVLGVTGTPGAGKSSLIGTLCLELLQRMPQLSIAVLAIDPSSQRSGGALLGDRTRIHFPSREKRLFFRSQASQQDLGGMAKSTFHVTRLLRKLFDLVIIETVGIGQSEIEIQRLSDHTLLVMQPLAGDQVQFMKAGIMEIPDAFVINKCDEDELARKSLHLLKASLKLARLQESDDPNSSPDIFMTSATRGKGIGELAHYLEQQLAVYPQSDIQGTQQAHEAYFLRKWVMQAYGEFGLGILQHFADEPGLQTGSFEQKELHFKRLVTRFLSELN